MKLGLGSYAFAWAIGVPGHRPPQPMDAFGLLDTAARLGAQVVQYADNLSLTELGEAELDRLIRAARARHLDLEVGTRGIQHGQLLRALAVARQAGAPFVRVVLDQGEDRPSPQEAVARLRPLRAAFEGAGVKLGIENHDRFSARTFAALVERLGVEWTGIVLDTVNSLGTAEGTAEVVQALAPYTLNLHVKDFTVRRVGHQMGFVVEGAPAGQGLLDVPSVLSALQASGRDVNAILELWPPPQGTLADTIALERAWAETSVRYLTGVLTGVRA